MNGGYRHGNIRHASCGTTRCTGKLSSATELSTIDNLRYIYIFNDYKSFQLLVAINNAICTRLIAPSKNGICVHRRREGRGGRGGGKAVLEWVCCMQEKRLEIRVGLNLKGRMTINKSRWEIVYNARLLQRLVIMFVGSKYYVGPIPVFSLRDSCM